MDLDLNVHKDGDHSVLEVAGEIDVYRAEAPRAAVELVSDGSYHIVVDLEKSTSDSTGLGVLVGGLKRHRRQSLQLVCTRRRSSRSSGSPG